MKLSPETDNPGAGHSCDVCRRTFLRNGLAGVGLLALNSLLDRGLLASTGVVNPLHHPAKAKRVIFLYQAGGPSHLETFDYKPKLARSEERRVGKECRYRWSP